MHNKFIILIMKKKSYLLLLIPICLLFLSISIGAIAICHSSSQTKKTFGGLTWYGAVDLLPETFRLPEKQMESEEDWSAFLQGDTTIALVADIPKEDIFVYELKVNGEEEGTYTLHGICVKQGTNVQVLDIDWGYYDEFPQVQYRDYDEDGSKELAMIVRSAKGTNLSIHDLHILKKNSDGHWNDFLYTNSDWEKIVNKALKYEETDGVATIFLDGKPVGNTINIDELEKEWNAKLQTVSVGSYGKFVFENDKIYLKVLPTAMVKDWATPQVMTDEPITMEVQYNNGFHLLY